MVFSCEICEIFKNIFFCRTLPVAAPVYTSLFTLTCLYLFTLTHLYLNYMNYMNLYEIDKIDKIWGI